MFPVGIDVSKNTQDLCMLYDGIKGRIKTRNIQNNRHSVENISLAQAPALQSGRCSCGNGSYRCLSRTAGH